MTGLAILDVVIGLTFVYLLLALICTTLMEWIAQLGNLRGRMLESGTRRLLGEEAAADPAVTKAYFDHPLVRTLKDGERMPSYVPGKVFAQAVTETLRRRAAEGGEGSERLRGSLQALAAARPGQAAADALPAEESLAEWYDQFMERLSGTYKRRTRAIVLLLAAVITVLLNADTVNLTTTLWRNPTTRDYVVERARVRLEQGPPLVTVEYTDPTNPVPTAPIAADSIAPGDQVLAEEQELLGRLFGWGAEPASLRSQSWWLWLLRHLVGWTLTALAVSLGAPFWFDTLNRFMSLRASGGQTPEPAPAGAK